MREDAPDPVDRIMAVMERAFDPQFGEAWNRRQVSDALLLGNCNFGLIGTDGQDISDKPAEKAAGFYLSRTVFDEEELLLFAVNPEHRRKGIGHLLLSQMISAAKCRSVSRIFLEMRKGNPAGHLYTAHGFRAVGVRPKYYRTPDGDRLDAISHELCI